MRKATRQFLKILSQVTDDAQVIRVLPVVFDYAKPNECYKNSMKFLEENTDFYIRSGWLVGEYWGVRGTAIIPHYWVYDARTQSDYDVTPIEGGQTFEYIVDMNIAENVCEEMKIVVPVPLKMNADGTLFARTGVGSYVELDRVEYDVLFQLAASVSDLRI